MNEILTVGIPTLAVLIGIPVNNSRLSDLRSHLDTRINDLKTVMDLRFAALESIVEAKFAAAHAQLIRVEQVMDARLKHLEDR